MKTTRVHKIISLFLWILFLCAMVTNVLLSQYIQVQKSANDAIIAEKCFIDGGCATVQTSLYATTFGIPNPIYGLVFFSIMSVFSLYIILQFIAPKLRHQKTIEFIDYISKFGLVLGSLFSLWLLYAQFFLIKATCIYCLWVDGLTITMTILYFILRKKIL